MAQTKKKAAQTPKKELKKSEDRVVKRPARGFHRFRSGLINVTPKGGEKELVRSNQNSLLLSLPPELRSRIWELAIGVNILRATLSPIRGGKQKRQLKPATTEHEHALALLRTCRQIYAETALVPYKSSIVTIDVWNSIKKQLRCLKSFQSVQIEDIQIEVHKPESIVLKLQILKDKTLNLLPGLKRIRMLVFNPDSHSKIEVEAWMEKARREFELIFGGQELSIVFEVSDKSLQEHGQKWK